MLSRCEIVPDAKLAAGVLPQFIAIVEEATDVGADLHVVFPQRLPVQHGIVRQHLADLQRSRAQATGNLVDQLVRNPAEFILRIEQHRDHRRALPSRRIAGQELGEPGFELWRKSHARKI